MNHYAQDVLNIVKSARANSPSSDERTGFVAIPYLFPDFRTATQEVMANKGDMIRFRDLMVQNWVELEMDGLDEHALAESGMHSSDMDKMLEFPTTGFTGRLLHSLLPEHCQPDGPLSAAVVRGAVPITFEDTTRWLVSPTLKAIIEAQCKESNVILEGFAQQCGA